MKKRYIWISLVVLVGACAFFAPRVFEDGIAIGNQATTITMDGSGNMQFADAVTGIKDLADLAGGGADLTEWRDSVTTVLKDTIVYGAEEITRWTWALWDSAQTIYDKKIGLHLWNGPDTLYITKVRSISPATGVNVEFNIYHAEDITSTIDSLFDSGPQLYADDASDVGESHTPDRHSIPPDHWVWFEWILITNDAIEGVSISPVGYVY